MQSNKLKLNTEKNWDDACRFISSVGCECADIGGSCIPFQTTVTYPGVHLDQRLSMKQHISSLCRTTFLALRRIASIPPFLSNSSTKQLVPSMITSRLDYCNATFAGVADEQIARTQKIQNNAARLILKKNLSVIMSHRFWKTPLAPSKIPHSVQARNARFPSLRRHSSAIPVLLSAHINHHSPFVFRQKDCSKFKNKLENRSFCFCLMSSDTKSIWGENLGWTFFWLHCSDCQELAADRPKSFSLPPNFQS